MISPLGLLHFSGELAIKKKIPWGKTRFKHLRNSREIKVILHFLTSWVLYLHLRNIFCRELYISWVNSADFERQHGSVVKKHMLWNEKTRLKSYLQLHVRPWGTYWDSLNLTFLISRMKVIILSLGYFSWIVNMKRITWHTVDNKWCILLLLLTLAYIQKKLDSVKSWEKILPLKSVTMKFRKDK